MWYNLFIHYLYNLYLTFCCLIWYLYLYVCKYGKCSTALLQLTHSRKVSSQDPLLGAVTRVTSDSAVYICDNGGMRISGQVSSQDPLAGAVTRATSDAAYIYMWQCGMGAKTKCSCRDHFVGAVTRAASDAAIGINYAINMYIV